MNDLTAEGLLLDIVREHEEAQRLISICKQQIDLYQSKIDEYKRRERIACEAIEAKLYEFFQRVPHRKTATQEIYDLPSGKLRFKAQMPEFKLDESCVIKSIRDIGAPEKYIETKETLVWSALKQDVGVLDDGTVIHINTGTVIDGIKAIPRPPKFVVDVSKTNVIALEETNEQ